MSFCKDHVYPLVGDLGNPKPINNIQRRIVPLTQGSVLEIGVGIGSDVMKPIAAPIVGGMITSTIHLLILVPVFANWETGPATGTLV